MTMLAFKEAPAEPAGADLAAIRDISQRDLAPIVTAIDRDGLYPEQVLRSFGQAGAFSSHLPGYNGTGAFPGEVETGSPSGNAPRPEDGAPSRFHFDRNRSHATNLSSSIEAMAIAGEHCLSTSFCMWCQDALGWYIYTSTNDGLKQTLGRRVATGEVLGGTGLSNPMKSLFGIERLRLKAKRVDGGYTVKGVLPWVSNLGPDHYFGGIFELEDNPAHRIMAVIGCDGPGITTAQNDHFVALEGTRTYSAQFRDAFVPDTMVLADPIDSFIPIIRSGFILLQAGMAFGMIRSCIDLMKQMSRQLGHVNCYLEEQPEHFEEQLSAMTDEVALLSATPFETDKEYWRRVIKARLVAGEASVRAAHNAMLHCGARGYVAEGAAQRRLREAYFVAIVTPATKQLRKMLAELDS